MGNEGDKNTRMNVKMMGDEVIHWPRRGEEKSWRMNLAKGRGGKRIRKVAVNIYTLKSLNFERTERSKDNDSNAPRKNKRTL